jgi:hypothetical protein
MSVVLALSQFTVGDKKQWPLWSKMVELNLDFSMCNYFSMVRKFSIFVCDLKADLKDK